MRTKISGYVPTPNHARFEKVVARVGRGPERCLGSASCPRGVVLRVLRLEIQTNLGRRMIFGHTLLR
jgi:hypothetical protein